MRRLRPIVAVILLAVLSVSCGSDGADTPAPDRGDPVGEIGDNRQRAELDGQRVAYGNPIKRGASLVTDVEGFAAFTMRERPLMCDVREESRVTFRPDDRVLVRWEPQGATSCRKGAEGGLIELQVGQTEIELDDAVFRVTGDGRRFTIQSFAGFVGVADRSRRERHIVGPDSELNVASDDPRPSRQPADVATLPAEHGQDVEAFKAEVPPSDYRLPPASGSPSLERLTGRQALRVATDGSGSAAARDFVDRFFRFVAAQWGLRPEISVVARATAADRVRAQTLDLFVSPEQIGGRRPEPFFDDETERTWNVFASGEDDGLRNAFSRLLLPALKTGEYGRRYQDAFGRPATYEAVRSIVFPTGTPSPPTSSTTPSSSTVTTTPSPPTTSTPSPTSTLPATTTTSARPTPLATGNLVTNPGAEASPATPPFQVGQPPAGWQRGAFYGIAAAYGSGRYLGSCPTARYPTVEEVGGAGANLFTGGYDADGGCSLDSGDTPTLLQVIPLAQYGGRTDGAQWEASALLASFPALEDGAQMIVEAMRGATVVASQATDVVSNPPGDWPFRIRRLTGTLPAGTTAVRITLSFRLTGVWAGYSVSFADEVSFRFTGGSRANTVD